MKEKLRTVPNLASNSPLHQAALAAGDEHYRLWQRNVIDEFKSLTDDEIKSTLRSTAFPFAVCFEHLIGDFNISSAIRNANAFNAREIFYLGDKKWDRRGALGVHNYSPVQWLPTVDDFIALKEKYVVVGIDNVPGSVPLSSYNFAPNTLLVFGEEGVGLTPTMQSHCKDLVYIEQFGSVRSLNVATASGIIMNDFVTKFRKQQSGNFFHNLYRYLIRLV